MKNLKIISTILFCLFAFSCKKDKDKTNEIPTLALEKTQYYPLEVAQINTTLTLTLTQKNYTGKINGEPITLLAFENSLVFLMPQKPAGNYVLNISLNGKDYNVNFKLLNSPIVTDPQSIIDAQIDRLTTRITELRTIASTLSDSDNIKFLDDVNLIERLKSKLQSQYDTLNSTAKNISAQTILANSWWIDEINNKTDAFILKTQNLRPSSVVDRESEVFEAAEEWKNSLRDAIIAHREKIALCTVFSGALGAIVGSGFAGIAGVAGWEIGTFGGAVLGFAGSVLYYYPNLLRIINAQINFVNKALLPIDEFSTNNLRITSLEYINNNSTGLEIKNTYRSLYNLDVNSTIPIVKNVNGFVSDVIMFFTELNDLLSQSFKFNPARIDNKLSYNTDIFDVHSNYISINNISNNKVSVSVEKQDGIVYAKFSTSETTDQDFTYEVQYINSNFGNHNYTVNAHLNVNNIKPIANFTANNTNVALGNTVQFTDLSTNNPTSWLWTFEGGTPSTSNTKNPNNIRYNTLGDYDVTLIATNADGSDTLKKTEYIHVTQNLNDTLKYCRTENTSTICFTSSVGGYGNGECAINTCKTNYSGYSIDIYIINGNPVSGLVKAGSFTGVTSTYTVVACPNPTIPPTPIGDVSPCPPCGTNSPSNQVTFTGNNFSSSDGSITGYIDGNTVYIILSGTTYLMSRC